MATNYTNRTDMMGSAQPVRAAKSTSYGDAATSVRKQKAVPLRQEVVPIGAPTRRPQEPITAGADFGPGPSMAGAGVPSPALPSAPGDDMKLRLRAIASQFPSAAVLGLLAELETPQ